MSLFGCKGCEGRDQEVRHLLAEIERLHVLVDKAQARICELAEPGIETRVRVGREKPERIPLKEKLERPQARYGFPGYDSLPTKTGDKFEVS